MFQELLEKSLAWDAKKIDFVRANNEFAFSDTARVQIGTLTMNIDGGNAYEDELRELPMTPWAFRQACEKYGVPTKYMERCPPSLRAVNLNHWRRAEPDKKIMFRVFSDTIRAALSDKYVTISNSWMLETIQALLYTVPYYTLVDTHLTPDVLHLKITLGPWPDEPYRFGAYVGNGEIGNSMVRVAPYIQRTSCSNSIIFMDGAFEQKHINVSHAFLRVAIKEKLGQAFKISEQRIAEFIKADEDAIPDLADVVAEICEKRGYPEEVHDNVLVGAEGHMTRFGLVNGFSWAAQQVDNPDDRIEMEILAGSLLSTRMSRAITLET